MSPKSFFECARVPSSPQVRQVIAKDAPQKDCETTLNGHFVSCRSLFLSQCAGRGFGPRAPLVRV